MREPATRYREAVVRRALQGPGTASAAARRAAFDNQGVPEPARALVAKVASAAWTVTDADVAAAKSAGVSEDEIFELTVCAALGQSTRQLDDALAALDAATTSATVAKSPPTSEGVTR
jgi:alkylhydroperoxidase/carboxymuconolactone decarboxylase family protein YurZ